MRDMSTIEFRDAARKDFNVKNYANTSEDAAKYGRRMV